MLPRLLFLLGLTVARLPADDLRALLDEATAAEARLDPAGALELFLQADARKPDDPFILYKIARQYSDQVPQQASDAARRDFASRGLAYARRASALEPTNAVYVLSLAICHGHLAVGGDVRTKVEMSRLVKEHAEQALRLDPNYAWAHHVLGRWHYEVASLGTAARFFVRLFYGGIPAASVDEGITHLRRATELEPTELNHWIYLGFACAAADQMTEARAAWARGLALPDRSTHDAGAKRRARAALENL
jgi:hypothetical protein